MTDSIQRRLAAILAADVAGYSRLMGEDEAGTLSALRHLRTELFTPAVDRHRGKVVKSMGDGWLVEFDSVVDAVTCAIEVQGELAGHDNIKLRVGVHLGDITHEEEDIFGDGVNIAARLQEIADPGGIVISDMAWRSIDGKLSAVFADLGVQDLKNIARPVTVYGWGMTAIRADATDLPLPDKPSIAVLPFDNMSGDGEQEYFSDGITEDIITELARFRSLFVTARNSSFSFKAQAIEAREIACQLGVRYLVEGSVRRAGNRVRITAQLIDAVHDVHLWAERYDRELEDIFAVQDEVTRAIVTAIEPELVGAERERARRKLPNNMDAWEWYQRGLWHFYYFTADENATAQEMFHRSIDLDPGFAQPQAALAYAIHTDLLLGFTQDPGDGLSRAYKAAKNAVALDDKDSFGLYVFGRICTMSGRHDEAIEAQDAAVALNPNAGLAHYGRGYALTLIGRAEEALDAFDEALRLSPRDPLAYGMMVMRSLALILLRRHEQAAEWARRSQRQPNAARSSWPHAQEAAALGHSGKVDEAQATLARVLSIHPMFSASFIDAKLPFKHSADRDHYIDGLRKAGLPQ